MTTTTKSLMRLLVIFLSALSLHAAAPVLFFTDITDGPRSGGENGKGAYIRVFGRNFGSTRGTSIISIGSGAAFVPVDNYPCWGTGNDKTGLWDMACFQLGNAVPNGAQNIRMTVGGVNSNTLPFTVRPDAADAIYCVATSGNATYPGSDSKNGHFLSASPSTPGQGCFATLAKATGSSPSTSAIIYDIDVGGSLNVVPANSGSTGAYSALLVYPGNTITLDATTGNAINIQSGNGFWVVGGFVLKTESGTAALQFHGGNNSTTETFNNNLRLVENEVTCPNLPGGTQIGCFLSSISNNVTLLGNNFHDVGCNVTGNPTGNQAHVNYFTTDVSHIEVGWSIYQNNCLRGEIHVHSSPLSIAGNGRVRVFRPIVSTTSGGSLGARTYYVRVSFQTIDPANSETYGSYEISQAVPANQFLTVHPYDLKPACCNIVNNFPNGTTDTTTLLANIFVGSSPNSETFQAQLTCTMGGATGLDPTCPTWTQSAEITTNGRAWPQTMSGSMDISGLDQIGVSIHDSIFSNFNSEGVLLGNADAACGTSASDANAVTLYNNLFIHGGPVGSKNQGQHTAIGSGGTENGRGPCGTIFIQNNTIWDIGATQSGQYGLLQVPVQNSTPDAPWEMDNNIFAATAGEPYFSTGGFPQVPGQVYGSNNLFFTYSTNVPPPAGTNLVCTGCTSAVNGSLNSDPQFVNPTWPAGDFHLQDTSPAKQAGITTAAVSDFNGTIRTTPFDLGVYVSAATVAAASSSNIAGRAAMKGRARAH